MLLKEWLAVCELKYVKHNPKLIVASCKKIKFEHASRDVFNQLEPLI